MSVISRGSLPANYEDFKTSVTAGLVLPQPEPQYIFAQWAMAGRISLAALNAGMQSAQQFVTMAGGGAPVSPALDRLARAADMYPGFVQVVENFGKGMGDTLKFQRPIYSTGGLTKADRKLNTGNNISTTGQTIQSEEIPLILEEYHGPFASGGTAVQPYAIWGFDAKFRANKLQLAGLCTNHLVRDYTYWLDSVVRDAFLQSTSFTFPEGVSNAAGFVSGGNAKFTLSQIMSAKKSVSDREWKKFPGGNYVCFVPTSFNVHMLEDVDYRESAKAHPDKNQLYGYISSVQDVDFFEVSTLKSYVATDVINGSTVATNVALDEAIMFGPGAVGFGTAAPDPEGVMGPVARFSDDTNYGTVAKVIWYALHAIETLDARGVQRVIAQTA